MNGKKFEEGNYDHGKKVGKWVNWFQSGDTLSLIHCENGLYRIWFKSGQKQIVGYVKDGEKHGVWKEFYITGNVLSEGSYENGVKKGQWRYYFENGEKMRFIDMENGKLFEKL